MVQIWRPGAFKPKTGIRAPLIYKIVGNVVRTAVASKSKHSKIESFMFTASSPDYSDLKLCIRKTKGVFKNNGTFSRMNHINIVTKTQIDQKQNLGNV